MLEYHRRMFTYDAWANGEVVGGLQRIGTPPGQAVALLAHITAAEELWLSRIQDSPTEIAVWPHWPLDRCIDEVKLTTKRWQDRLGSLAAAELPRECHYRNSQGEDFMSTVGDVLTHVIIHSVYHRAQIASVLREEGVAPAFTDFIHATRDHHLK